jgi:amino-acid N-acetyltransferase
VLLRSIVALRPRRAYGSTLVREILSAASAEGAQRAWLLTTDCRRLGFAATPRDTAPEAVARSRQFADLCPASATLMVRDLA